MTIYVGETATCPTCGTSVTAVSGRGYAEMACACRPKANILRATKTPMAIGTGDGRVVFQMKADAA